MSGALGQKVHGKDEGGGSSGLCSARFLAVADAHTGTIISDSSVVIIWDDDAEFDDLGFVSEYHTNGKLWPPEEGDYLITVSAQVAAVTAFTTGTMLLSIETAVSLVNTGGTTQVSPFNTNPEVSISTVHRFPGGMAEFFQVHVKMFGCDDDSGVSKAALTITKLGPCGTPFIGG